MMWGYGYGWGGALWMSLSMLLGLALVGLAVWVLVRWLGGRPTAPGPSADVPSAIEVVQQRYARGEMDAATYEDMRRRLAESVGERERDGQKGLVHNG
jgi:putative membrane protein